MKKIKMIMLFGLATGLAWGRPLTEESIRELLKTRSEAFEQADVETILGLYTTNAVISVSFFGMPGSKEETDPREFAEAFSMDMKLVAYSTDPSKIDWVDGGARVAAETHLSHVPGKNRNRAISWQIRETFNFALIDNRPKITEERMAIVNQTLEPDELSERIMKLVRQDGGIDKETALKLLEESGCKYEEGDSKRKKSSISAGYGIQCGDEIGALASYVPGVQSLQLGMSIISDEGLAVISMIQTLEALHLMGMGITDTGIGYLANLDRLEVLSMMGVGITDASFEHFAGFPALKKLHLTAALSVTDAGLFHLSKNETLESLTLTINMTDAGLAHLANVPNLGYLRIQGAPITDAGLVHVEQMEKLTSITLNSTEVTHIGARRLKAKRPQLKISPLSLVEPCAQARSRIEYAKKKWAENEKQKEGATPTREELDLLLKRYGGFNALTCVDGGILSINPIGIGAECSIHGKTKARKPTTPMKGLSKEDFDTDGAKVGRWTMDLEAAKKLAGENQLPILINFTGSDWCGWCKLMEKNVFTQKDWKAYATNHIVMVLIDFPRDKTAVPEKYIERNNALKGQYGISGYPTFVLLKPDGTTELARLKAGRNKTPASFIEEIKALLKLEERP